MVEYTHFDTSDGYIPPVITERRAYIDVMGGLPVFVKFVEPFYKEDSSYFYSDRIRVEELQAHLQEDAAITSRLLGD